MICLPARRARAHIRAQSDNRINITSLQGLLVCLWLLVMSFSDLIVHDGILYGGCADITPTMTRPCMPCFTSHLLKNQG